MCERKTGKLVTGPAAPTESTLLSWLLRHPSFEVVQPTHQGATASMCIPLSFLQKFWQMLTDFYSAAANVCSVT